MTFPPPHIHPPTISHTHTIIFLHGRGSNGPEFASDLFSSKSSTHKNLAQTFPSHKWVFPTSRDRWSTTFQEEQCAWFDAHSLDDTTQGSESQVEGLRESVFYILDLLEKEAEVLDGRFENILLGGISQGMGIALWTLFGAAATGRITGRLGGVLGLCGWLHFAEELEQGSLGLDDGGHTLCEIFHEKMSVPGLKHWKSSWIPMLKKGVLMTPVFLGHGTDDVWISIRLGMEAHQIMKHFVDRAEWYEFSGAEGDGHWIKEPEGFDQIVRFLRSSSSNSSEVVVDDNI
ncbi:hypothetical protein PENSTE_c010G05417 [Penicillium steckii]|uniref:Phospholipase/carboxylesterase/thioesterase domain-containing protein n=1 Tax=Penicillium steckii TaxID=303698 RepID=A0A1V6T922_9EURO|nr:hypothetical protein PENSTE_c010G05417 [Penicillium steckii]